MPDLLIDGDGGAAGLDVAMVARRLGAGVLGDAGGVRPGDVVLATGGRAAVRSGRFGPGVRLWILEDEGGMAPGAFGLRALAEGRRSAVLRLVDMSEGERVLDEAATRIVPHSRRATAARLLEVALDMVARQAARPEPVPVPALPSGAGRGRAGVALPWPLAAARNLAMRLWQEAQEEHWSIGIVRRPAWSLIGDFRPEEVTWLRPPAGMFLADPFCDPKATPERDGRLEIFAEGFRFDERIGHIVRLGGGDPDPVLALRLPVHLSYPQILHVEGRRWMLPECHEANRLQAFVEEEGGIWSPGPVVMDGVALADATMLVHEGRHWLFACRSDDERESRLFAFHAPGPGGPWEPHRLNPIRSDIRGSRPGGPFFRHAGRLFRPAQDCSTTYGGALVINEVLRLDTSDFREQAVARLEPDPAGPCPHGLHTLCPAGEWTLIDGKRHRPAWRPLAALVRSQLAALRTRRETSS